jgi:hypothetical protein
MLAPSLRPTSYSVTPACLARLLLEGEGAKSPSIPTIDHKLLTEPQALSRLTCIREVVTNG